MNDTATKSLVELAKSKQWDALDQAWLAAAERDIPPVGDLLESLERAVEAGRGEWAEASAWAWLTEVKEGGAPSEALDLARKLLLRLKVGEELRKEVLELYRQTHTDTPELDMWIERSGLAGGASVRKALRYLDVALQMTPGTFLAHRSDEGVAEVKSIDVGGDDVAIKTPAGAKHLDIDQLIDDYHPVGDDDFRVLRDLYPARIAELAVQSPLRLVVGVLQAHGGRFDRDELKLLLVPRHMKADAWSGWWSKLRTAIKKSANVTLEGRSPMFLVYHAEGRTLEAEFGELFDKAATPRDFLGTVEGYFRECKSRRSSPDAAFLNTLAGRLAARVSSLARHDPDTAFAIALVIERLAQEGLPLPEEVHGMAVRMMAESDHPAALVLASPDTALWPPALGCVRQALPETWPQVYAQLIPGAPVGQCDWLAKAVEEAGHGDALLPGVVERILDRPQEHVEGLLWLWKGPSVRTTLRLPPLMDLFNHILKIIGPSRGGASQSAKKLNAMRAIIRSGLSASKYARFRQCIEGKEQAMAAALRRNIERADGLGPVVRDELTNVIRQCFPALFLKAKVEPWDDPNILWATEAGLRKRQAELDELVNVKLKENAIAIGNAIEHGDLSENSEYKFALEERDLLHARIGQIQMELSLSRVLEPWDVPTEHVGIGHCVQLTAANGGGARTMTILGPWESDLDAGIYSYQAPLARNLLGKKSGDTVKLILGESDEEADYRIESFNAVL